MSHTSSLDQHTIPATTLPPPLPPYLYASSSPSTATVLTILPRTVLTHLPQGSQSRLTTGSTCHGPPPFGPPHHSTTYTFHVPFLSHFCFLPCLPLLNLFPFRQSSSSSPIVHLRIFYIASRSSLHGRASGPISTGQHPTSATSTTLTTYYPLPAIPAIKKQFSNHVCRRYPNRR